VHHQGKPGSPITCQLYHPVKTGNGAAVCTSNEHIYFNLTQLLRFRLARLSPNCHFLSTMEEAHAKKRVSRMYLISLLVKSKKLSPTFKKLLDRTALPEAP